MTRPLLIAFFVFLLLGTGHAGPAAPAFEVRDITGTTLSLEHFRGKVLFLAFWAPWCITCRDELPELDNLYRKYRSDGFAVVGISEDASEAAVSAFVKKVPVSFPIAIDPRSSVADAFRLSNLPSGYLIGRDGVIRHRYRGFNKSLVKTYEKDIRELLEQRNP
ncbi:MAG: TlpA disulfide reductase family protein [Nitrospirota bacterium]